MTMIGERFSRVTRWFLSVLIGSIGIGALIAIWIVLAGNWGWFEARILLTAGTVAVASIFGMASGAAMSRGRGAFLPAVGVGLAILGAGMLIAGMWIEIDSATYWKITASVSIFAAASAHVALLSLARLKPSHEWAQLVAFGLALLFATILVVIIVWETGNDAVIRLLAVVGILDAALTLIVPVLHYLDRGAVAEIAGPGPSAPALDLAAIDDEIARLRARLTELEEERRAAIASA